VKRKIDLTIPFIAIRKDLPGDPYTATMGEYLCNPLNEALLDVEISSGGFYSAEDLGVVESVVQEPKPIVTIPAGESFRFALSTEDEYDEMVVHWSLRYRTATLGAQTDAFGSFQTAAQWLEDVPTLGGPGNVVPRSVPDEIR